MGLLFKRFKTKFRYALKPLFAMLVARKKDLSKKEWIEAVIKVRERMNGNPVEYLGTDLPDESLLRDVLDEIFQEFLKECAYHESASSQQLEQKIFGTVKK
jgi:hypothetical protein